MARSPPKRALSPEGGVTPRGGTGRSAWHAGSQGSQSHWPHVMCAADAWVFARVLGVRVRLVRGCWRGCKGGRICAGFDGPAYNRRIATLRAAEEIRGLRHEDERVVLLFLVVVRAVEELAESRVVCLRDSAWVSGAAGGVGDTPAGR